MSRLLTLAAVTLTATSLGACAHVAASSSKPFATPDARRAAIQHAQIWSATDVASMDLRIGPKGKGAFAPDAPVTCTYVEKKMSGNTPKFTCVIPPDDDVKVKYGRHNPEVSPRSRPVVCSGRSALARTHVSGQRHVQRLSGYGSS